MAFVRTQTADGRVEFRDLSPPPMPQWAVDSAKRYEQQERQRQFVQSDGTINGQKLKYLPDGATFEHNGKTYDNKSQVDPTALNQGRSQVSPKPSGLDSLSRSISGTGPQTKIVGRSGDGTLGTPSRSEASTTVIDKPTPKPFTAGPPPTTKTGVGVGAGGKPSTPQTGGGVGRGSATPTPTGRGGSGAGLGGGVGFGLSAGSAGGASGLGVSLANAIVSDYILSKPSQFDGVGQDRNSAVENIGNGIVSGAGQLSSALRDALFGSSKPPSLENGNFGKPIPGNRFPPDGSVTLSYPYDDYEFSYSGEYDQLLIGGGYEHRTIFEIKGRFSGQPVSIEVRKDRGGESANVYYLDLSNTLQVVQLSVGTSNDNSAKDGHFTAFNFQDIGGGEILKVLPPPTDSSNFEGDIGSAGSSESSWMGAGGTGEFPGGMGSELGTSLFSGSSATGAGVGSNSAPSQFSGPRSSVAGAGASSSPGPGVSRGPGPSFNPGGSAASGVGTGGSTGTGTGTTSSTFFGNGTTSNGIGSENKTTKQLKEETKTRTEKEPEPKPETKTPPNCEDPCIQGLHDKLNNQNDVIKIKVPIFKACILDSEGIKTGEGESKEVEMMVPKLHSQAIASQFLRLFRIESLQCRDPIALVPDWWKLRRGSSVPQLAILFAEQRKSGKLGSSRWTMHIPHYDRPNGFKPNIPAYSKGNWQGVLTLADGSKLGVNASSASECKRVINKLKIMIPVQFRTMNGKTIQPKITENPDANLKQVRVVPVRADFFHQGSLNPEPKWSIDLRK